MKKIPVLALALLLYITALAQPVLSGEFNNRTSEVELEWNMVSHTSRTGYIIFRSKDGANWAEFIRDRVVKNYSDEDVYNYGDKSFSPGLNYYRVKIVDISGNIVAQSNIIQVNTREAAAGVTKSSWIIYPNPVTDILNIAYKGNKQLQGCYNLTIKDVAGKVVIRYRCASIYKSFQVPVDKLQRGTYQLEVMVNNAVLVNERFVK